MARTRGTRHDLVSERPSSRRAGAHDPVPGSRAGERAAARAGEAADSQRELRSRRTPPPGTARRALRQPSFLGTLKALDVLSTAGAHVSVRVSDLDSGDGILVGDDHLTLPVAGLGIVPLLIEVAAQIEARTLDPLEILERASVDPVGVAGLWQHLKAPALPVCDLAVLTAAASDASAANALLARVGLDAVRARVESIGLTKTALLDRFRDVRGPDDAPQVALASAGELAALFAAIVNAQVVSPAVSAQVGEWLNLTQDLALVGSATAMDPFAHEDDRHGLLFVNKTGRADGIRAEAGVIAGPRGGLSYALIVCFDDLSIAHRLRANEAFHTLGLDLMEYVY
ncbi:class A beta-lactamase-related serine hydrolase [Microbacterium memoriense]|uniref:Class A beta-lactamase-related serine hydrolase n=1 Tax=Microbacterium memoriense TaxID=2978350 RepID=A0ABT2PD86_9MICO|nr:class A beta-lactamase-related serine hydrolase [Microbacterium memoriense]MCT9002539.1 class A beta-lactamase-related serine hydrolase [Microbacterium memoriense]